MTALPPDVVADLRQENARLQAELRASRDRQAGSAEILRAIAGTSGDAEQALQQIAETSARLFGAPSVSLRIAENGEWVQVFRLGASAEAEHLHPLAVLGNTKRNAGSAEQTGAGFGDLLQRLLGVTRRAGNGAQDFGTAGLAIPGGAQLSLQPGVLLPEIGHHVRGKRGHS